MSIRIQKKQWHMIDEMIFTNRKLDAFKQIRALTGCHLREAIDAFSQRYEMLRKECPERFSDSVEEYWGEFYS